MNKKTISRSLSIAALLILPLSSCRVGVVPPSMREATGTYSEIKMPLLSPIPATPSTTPSLTATGTGTMTPTRNPAGFELKDWREPVEGISSVNFMKVELVGKLVIQGGSSPFGWSPDGSKIAISTTLGTFLFDGFTFEKIDHWQTGRLIAFSPDGEILDTGEDRFNLKTGEKFGLGTLFNPYPGYLTDIEFSANNEYIVASGTGFIAIHLRNRPTVKYFSLECDDAMHVSISKDSQVIAVSYKFEDFTEIWNPYLGTTIRVLKLKGISAKGKPRFSKDNASLFLVGSGEWEGQEASFIQEWDYRSGTPRNVQLIPGIFSPKQNSFDLSPDEDLVAVGTVDGKVRLLPVQGCQSLELIGDTNDELIGTVAFRPDGKILASTTWEGDVIYLWGIPASDPAATIGPEETTAATPAQCPTIPMIVENPTPVC